MAAAAAHRAGTAIAALVNSNVAAPLRLGNAAAHTSSSGTGSFTRALLSAASAHRAGTAIAALGNSNVAAPLRLDNAAATKIGKATV